MIPCSRSRGRPLPRRPIPRVALREIVAFSTLLLAKSRTELASMELELIPFFSEEAIGLILDRIQTLHGLALVDNVDLDYPHKLDKASVGLHRPDHPVNHSPPTSCTVSV